MSARSPAGSGAAAAKVFRKKKTGGHHAHKTKKKPMTLLEQAEYQISLSKAQSKEMAMRKLFSEVDADKSGFIERSELRSLLLLMGFTDADANGGFDHFLSAEFRRSDSSGDGKIDFGEFVALHNRLIDQSNNIQHLNHAISLVDATDKSMSDPSAYLTRVELLAAADRGMTRLSNDTVVALDMMGETPTMEVLQVFTCILILFGLPEGESAEADWHTAQVLFDGPTFIEDLRTFDHMKLRRNVIMRALQRSEGLVKCFSSLETRAPVAHALLCWVLVLIARAKHDAALDAPTLDIVPVQRRSSFIFSLGTNDRRGVWRLLDSEMFEGNFHKKRERNGTPGVTVQIGRLESNMKEAVASIMFDRRKFTEQQAGEWWNKHKGDPQFATAVAAAAAIETPRVDYDFGSPTELKEESSKRGYRHVPEGFVEHWGYNEDGEFTRTLVPKESSFGLPTVNLVAEEEKPNLNSVGLPISPLMENAVSALSELKEEVVKGLASLDEEPKYGEITVNVVSSLLGDQLPSEPSWASAKAALSEGFLERMRTFDVRLVSRSAMRGRIKSIEKYFLDPGYTPQTLKGEHPVVYAMLRWSKAVITAADDAEAVTAGRSIDNSLQSKPNADHS